MCAECSEEPQHRCVIVGRNPDPQGCVCCVRVPEVFRPVVGRQVRDAEDEWPGKSRIGEHEKIVLEHAGNSCFSESLLERAQVRRIKADEGRPLTLRGECQVPPRQLVLGDCCRNQLDASAVCKLDMHVADAVRMKTSWLEGESESPIVLRRTVEVPDCERNVVDPDEGPGEGGGR